MSISVGSRLGPYEILAPLGAGGMGEVYRARDAKLGRDIALKVLPERVSADRDRLSRFEQEARSASALNHPNIITIYEIGQAEQVSYIAMELVDGKTLRELCSAADPMPVRRTIGIAVQIAEGLAKAHGAGIVHRDLKPENVMVSKDGYVKILDFGLAKLVEPDSGGLSAMPTLARPETHPGTVLGTVGYMSPEQAGGQPLDFRSDQFSFGSILYEIVSGQKAFSRKTAAETMSAIIREEPEPLAKLRSDAPPPLRWIIERCLAKDPEERYASTRDLARELASVRDHISEVVSGSEALVAGPIKPRRRLATLLTAAALAGVVAGAVGAMNLWKKAPAQAPSFHRLTFRAGNLGNGRFAPDGQTIVYGATWAGDPTRTMYSMRVESPESRPYDFQEADILAISSSGEMAFLLGEVGKGGILARAPLAGGAPREVLEGVPYAGADWMPNGKELAVIHSVGPRQDRLEYPIGKVIVESADNPECPRFSPRGDTIAFLSTVGDSTFVAVVDVSGKGKKILSKGWTAIAGAPCWTPNGKEIWFTAADSSQATALYAVDLNGRSRLITRVPGSLELDDISGDGRVLANHHTILEIVSGMTSGQDKERDLSWLDGSSPSDLSLDGRTLVLTESGEGSGAAPAVYLRKTDGSPAARLGEGVAFSLSPDGKWVLASVSAGGGKPERLVLLPTGPGETRIVNDKLELFTGAAWLPDGKRFVFSAREKGHLNRIFVQSLGGGDPMPLSPEGVFLRPSTNLVTPDGKFVLGRKSGGGASLYPVERSGGEARPVAGLDADDWPVQWSQDGRFLYVHQRRGVPNKVWQLDPASGKKTPWLEIRPGEPVGGIESLLMTRDGKSYVYGTTRVLSELYLIEGLR